MDLENENDALQSCLKRRIKNIKKKSKLPEPDNSPKIFESSVLDIYFGLADVEFKAPIKKSLKFSSSKMEIEP
jgi:hypothetical protein